MLFVFFLLLFKSQKLLHRIYLQRLDIRRAKSQESLAYHSELTEQAAQRQEMKQKQKQIERAQSERVNIKLLTQIFCYKICQKA